MEKKTRALESLSVRLDCQTECRVELECSLIVAINLTLAVNRR